MPETAAESVNSAQIKIDALAYCSHKHRNTAQKHTTVSLLGHREENKEEKSSRVGKVLWNELKVASEKLKKEKEEHWILEKTEWNRLQITTTSHSKEI